ncbi:hypothetical protein NS44R_14625, partial [Mammaliicoccus sciuri]
IHLGLEEREGAAEIALGARQRHVGALQQLFGILAVAGRHRDPDAGADHHRMPLEQIGLADRIQDPPRQQHGVLGPHHAALHDGEFVGVETGQRIFLAQRRAQTLGDGAQQLVADAVAERLVDRLEIVEPQHQHRDLVGRAAGMLQHLVHLLAQQVTVGQAGQAVVLGHEGQPRLGALALGDVHQREQHRRLVAVHQLAR